MFTLIDNPEFTHAIPVMVPVDGGYEERGLKVRFRVLPSHELSDYDIRTPEGCIELLTRVVVRVDDVADETGQSIAWGDHLRDRLFGLLYIRQAMVNGYIRALGKAKAGN
ncbi:hypothetical protein [Oceaniglobus trochenteri]|uniref:hypothetical protein n=1 Tax=Oceaniglobus trochenteri TaxID=2763260 RepID=UPI001CFFFC74|nr:hypothetical protein [Oceaniglobus trochenteri]